MRGARARLTGPMRGRAGPAGAGRGGPPVANLEYQEPCDQLRYVVPRVDEVMALLAGRVTGHLDLKETGYESEVVALASSILGPGNFVLTTWKTQLGVARTCHRNGIGIMVWAADDDVLIDRFLMDQRIDVLITNRPAHAARRRSELGRDAAAAPGAGPGRPPGGIGLPCRLLSGRNVACCAGKWPGCVPGKTVTSRSCMRSCTTT